MGGICIYLTEGDEGIEAMKRDLRDGDGREITVEELKDYLIRKIERIAMID